MQAIADEITCSVCDKKQKAKLTRGGNLRVPRGWKRFSDAVYCPDCKNERYRLRAVTFPVASVDGEWKEFCDALKDAWGRSTRLANWSVRQMLLADSDRGPGDEKMSPMPTVNLYDRWQDQHEREGWDGAAAAANALMHAVESKYREKRYDVLWLNKDRPPRYTYPYPYPVHNAAWKAEYVEITGKDGQTMRTPAITAQIGGRRWTIHLRGGPQRWRQLASFAQIVSGEAIKGQLDIYRVAAGTGSHRRTIREKMPGGGQTKRSRIMVKLVAYLPRSAAPEGREGILTVRTGRKALIVASVSPDERPWLYHANHVRRLIYEHNRKLQAINDDLKAEARPASPALRDRLDAMCYRHRCRIDSELRRLASMVAKYAVRRKCADLVYNDSDHRYFSDGAPWDTLRRYIAEACDREHVDFRLASGEVVESDSHVEIDSSGDGE
jgi:hypothetical protein